MSDAHSDLYKELIEHHQRGFYYNRAGEPIDLMQWAHLMEDHDYKVVEQTVVNDRWLVSTVWLGIDHGFLGPPMIFETMVFAQGQPADDWEVRRYATEADARVGHADMVAVVEALDGV